MTKRILVTGGAGMIGSNLVKGLLAAGHRVTVVDNLWRGKLEYLHDQGRPVLDLERNFFRRDLSEPRSLEGLLDEVDLVYHLADVVAGIDYVFKNQGAIFRQNMLINSNVIEAVRRAPSLQGYIYVGTACSFPMHLQSGVDARPLKESDQYPAAPESAYGWSKLMGEYEALLLEQETGMPVSILSLHNVYGSPCDYGAERSQVLPSLIRKAIEYPDSQFKVWGSGNQGRAFIHVDDVVAALKLAMQRGLGQGVIQIGPTGCTTIRQIAEIITKISGKDIPILYDLSKPEGDRGRSADCTKALEVLGWSPQVPLSDGIQRLYDWIDSQMRGTGKTTVVASKLA